MRRRIALTIAAWMLATAWPGPVVADDARGYFGFSLNVDGEGFFLNPTLKSVTVTEVVPSSPAADAGIAAGDLIVEAESHTIAGAKARDLEPILKKQVGESLHLRLTRKGGAPFDVTLVARTRPAKP